jgi:hypothetical protein
MHITKIILLVYLNFNALQAMENLPKQDTSLLVPSNFDSLTFFLYSFPKYIENSAPTLLHYTLSPDRHYIDLFDLKNKDNQPIIDTITLIKTLLCLNKQIYTTLFYYYKKYLRKIIDTSCYDHDKFVDDEEVSKNQACTISFEKKIIKPFQNTFWHYNTQFTSSRLIIQELYAFSAANWYISENEKIAALDRDIENETLEYLVNDVNKNFVLSCQKILAFMPKNFTMVIRCKNITLLDSARKSFISQGLILNENYRKLWTNNAEYRSFQVLEITQCTNACDV